MDRIKLFCLPYAGGSAMVYSKWKKYLHNMIDLHPVELAGRGNRLGDPFYNTFEEAVDDVYKLIESELDGSPYAIFGHSMGSLLVYELYCRIREYKQREPVHLFFSGWYPPHINKNRRILHLLPDIEFWNEILKYGGTSPEIMEHPELISIFIPILKADFRMLENHNNIPLGLVFNHDITAFYGREDIEVDGREIEGWRKYTGKQCNIYEFDGGHFFINNESVRITSIINNTLTGE
jgi:medium-chain acyl-[acyl-carrier-protein] hydrolase